MSREAGTPFGPRDLPPQAAGLVSQYSRMLQELPPVLAASLLSQVRGYDWQFPAERRELEEQLRFLSVSRCEETQRILTNFRELSVPQKLMKNAWIAPEAFLQEFTAYLWQAHAMDQFRKCGEACGTILTSVREQCASSSDRLVLDGSPADCGLNDHLIIRASRNVHLREERQTETTHFKTAAEKESDDEAFDTCRRTCLGPN
jgi:hypothetical protein